MYGSGQRHRDRRPVQRQQAGRVPIPGGPRPTRAYRKCRHGPVLSRRLRDNGQLARNGLVEISEFTGGGDADIEDLFDRDFYLKLVNRAYASKLSQPITPADLTPGDPRVVRAIEAYFRQHGIADEKFNHYRPAAILLREQATLLPMIADATINRADRLFTRLNGLLP